MKKLCLCLLFSSIVGFTLATEPEPGRYGLAPGKAELKSAGALTFGPDGILFVADTQGAAVFALDVKDNAADTATTAVEIEHIDKAVAAFLGIAAEDVVINDMAVQPNSQNIYLSVSRGRSVDAQPVIIRVARNKTLSEVKTDNIMFAKADIRNIPGVEEKTSWGAWKRPMAITDLSFFEGTLYVAGLSNAEFASTLRKLSFPFKGNDAYTSVEVYHTSHNRYETQAPIETFLPIKLNNEPHILAGYGCAPLAKFRLSELKEQKHVKGYTLAELGGGSRPLDMVIYKRKGEDHVAIANSNRTIYRMKVSDLEKAEQLTTPVSDVYVSSGTPFVATGIIGVVQLDDLNAKYMVAIQRDIKTGALNLVSLAKRWI